MKRARVTLPCELDRLRWKDEPDGIISLLCHLNQYVRVSWSSVCSFIELSP